MERLGFLGKFILVLASTMFLFVVGTGVPPAGIALLPFVPQPALAFGFKHGIVWGVAALLAGPVIFLILRAEELALLYAAYVLMGGLLFALLGRVRALESLVAAVAGALFAFTGGLMLYFFGSWSAMTADFRASMVQQAEAAKRLHEKIGLSQGGAELFRERLPELIDLLLRLLPALVFLSLAFVVLVNILFLCRRFPERRGEWLAVENLREWKGPEAMVWGLIVCGFALFIPGLDFARAFAVNLLLVIGAAYFAQGLAVIAFFFHKNNVPRFLRAVTYIVIVFQQIFTLMVAGLGLCDLWGDFRRLKKNDLTPSRAS